MQEKIREVLSGVIDPNTGKDLFYSKALKKVTTEDGKTTVQIELDYLTVMVHMRNRKLKSTLEEQIAERRLH